MNDRIFKQILMGGIAVLLIFAPLARGAAHLWSTTVMFLVIYILLFLWLFRVSGGGIQRPALKNPGIDLSIFAFLALAFISAIFSVYKHDSIYAFLRLLGYIGAYYLIAYNFDVTMKRRLLGLVLLIGTGLSLYGLLQYIGILDHSWWYPSGFLAASYVNHNHFAGYLELVIPVAVGLLAQKRAGSIYYRFGLTAALCLMCTAFIFTQSRGGWLSLAISLIAMNVVLIRKKFLNKNALFGLGFIIIIVFVVLLAQGNNGVSPSGIATERITQGDSDLSLKGRLDIWEASVGMIRERPFVGFSIGDFDKGFYRYRPEGFNERAIYAHNEYLHMAVEMGILAPLLMVLLFIVVLGSGLRMNTDLAMVGCCCGMLSLTLHGLIDFNFHIPANMLLFCIYGAFIRSGDHTPQEELISPQ